MSNYEKLMDTPGVENCHPKFIATINGKKEFVAEVIDGTVYLTDAGKKLFAEMPDGDAKPAKKGKKAAPVVESANTSAGEADELDLGE